MQYLLPRVSKLEKIAFATKQTNYRRDSQKRNIYDNICLSHLLDLQYTKVSQHSVLQFNELIIDIQIEGFEKDFIDLATVQDDEE